MKENKKQSSKSQTKNSKETTKNTETPTDSFEPIYTEAEINKRLGIDSFAKEYDIKHGTRIIPIDKQEFTEEIIRKVFIKNAHHKDGGALGILLPKEVKSKMQLNRGDYVFIKASNDTIIIRKCLSNGARS